MSRRMLLVILALLPLSSRFAAKAEEPSHAWRFDPALMEPFWLSDTMRGETVLFVKGNDDDRPRATLLFVPTKILAVTSSSGETTYTEGKDYVWRPGTRRIELPPGSRIVFKTPQELRRPAGSQRHRLTHRDGNGEILFGALHEYHAMQTAVTYAHRPDAWTSPRPAFAGKQLPQTLAKLRAKKPLCIVLHGDSISTGCNASGWSSEPLPPYQPPFQELFARNLEAAYGGKVALKNISLGGADTRWGLSTISQVIEAEPDLVILAFGMNDSASRRPADFQALTRQMTDAVRKARPQAEFILVAPMLPNRGWTLLHHDYFPPYRDALAELCGPGVALADMTSIWNEMFKQKQDWDLTGNGVNHPNDFGHRVYAQVLSALLIAE